MPSKREEDSRPALTLQHRLQEVPESLYTLNPKPYKPYSEPLGFKVRVWVISRSNLAGPFIFTSGLGLRERRPRVQELFLGFRVSGL